MTLDFTRAKARQNGYRQATLPANRERFEDSLESIQD
jgi:hypothetical protein